MDTQGQISALQRMVGSIGDLDPATYERETRLRLLDAMGCILYGATKTDAAAIISGTAAFGWGAIPLPSTKLSFTPDTCALVMGALCHLRELDDVHSSIIHPGACVVPAAWAAAYDQDLTMGELLDAIFVGYEAAVRISEASGYLVHREKGWHATATFGPFGAAMAVARLLDLPHTETVWALGIAGARAGGTWAFAQDSAMTKRLHPGMAARDGLQGAYLAKASVTGPAYLLEADDGGLFPMMGGDTDITLLEKQRQTPASADTEVKLYASCKSVHTPYEAAKQIYDAHRREAQADAIDINPKRIKVYINTSAKHMAGRMYEKGSVTSAQLSIPYGVALALSGRDGSAADYMDEQLTDDKLYALASLVEMEVSAEMDGLREKDNTSSARVDVEWGGGLLSSAFVKAAKGSIERPLSADEIIAKFLGLAEVSVGNADAQRMAEGILQTGRSTPVRTILA